MAQTKAASLALLLLTSCAGAFASLDLKTLPTAQTYPNTPAVRLIDHMTLSYGQDAQANAYLDIENHSQWRVLRKGEDAWGRIVVHYRRAFDKILEFEARTVSPTGEVKRYTLTDCNDYPARAGFELYTDSRVAVLEVPVAPNTVVEYRSVVRTNELRLWPHTKGFGESIPSASIQLTVRHPKAWEVVVTEHKSDLAALPTMTQTSDAEMTVLTWTVADAKSLPWDESDAPSVWELSPQIAVYASKWQHAGALVESAKDEPALARYLYGITQQQAPVGNTTNEELAKIAKENTAPADSPRDKARKLYNWVRDNVSYCAIEIGMGGFKPHAAEDVFRLKYGDCKDKANLLRRLLQAVDVPSELVLIHSHRGFPRERLTLTGGNFNHAILGVLLDNTLVLTDPTSRTAPFGRLPRGDQGSPWMRLNEQGSSFARTPQAPAMENSVRMQLALSLQGDKLDGQLTLESDGVPADNLRSALISAAQGERPKSVAASALLGSGTQDKLEVKTALAPAVSEPLQLQMHVSLDGPQGASVLFHPSDVAKIGLPSFSDYGDRKVPLLLPSRRHTEQKMTLALGTKYELGALPEPVTIESGLGRYTLSYKIDKGVLVIQRSLTLNESVVPVSRFKEAKQFFDDALKADARPILLKQKGA